VCVWGVLYFLRQQPHEEFKINIYLQTKIKKHVLTHKSMTRGRGRDEDPLENMAMNLQDALSDILIDKDGLVLSRINFSATKNITTVVFVPTVTTSAYGPVFRAAWLHLKARDEKSDTLVLKKEYLYIYNCSQKQVPINGVYTFVGLPSPMRNFRVQADMHPLPLLLQQSTEELPHNKVQIDITWPVVTRQEQLQPEYLSTFHTVHPDPHHVCGIGVSLQHFTLSPPIPGRSSAYTLSVHINDTLAYTHTGQISYPLVTSTRRKGKPTGLESPKERSAPHDTVECCVFLLSALLHQNWGVASVLFDLLVCSPRTYIPIWVQHASGEHVALGVLLNCIARNPYQCSTPFRHLIGAIHLLTRDATLRVPARVYRYVSENLRLLSSPCPVTPNPPASNCEEHLTTATDGNNLNGLLGELVFRQLTQTKTTTHTAAHILQAAGIHINNACTFDEICTVPSPANVSMLLTWGKDQSCSKTMDFLRWVDASMPTCIPLMTEECGPGNQSIVHTVNTQSCFYWAPLAVQTLAESSVAWPAPSTLVSWCRPVSQPVSDSHSPTPLLMTDGIFFRALAHSACRMQTYRLATMLMHSRVIPAVPFTVCASPDVPALATLYKTRQSFFLTDQTPPPEKYTGDQHQYKHTDQQHNLAFAITWVSLPESEQGEIIQWVFVHMTCKSRVGKAIEFDIGRCVSGKCLLETMKLLQVSLYTQLIAATNHPTVPSVTPQRQTASFLSDDTISSLPELLWAVISASADPERRQLEQYNTSDATATTSHPIANKRKRTVSSVKILPIKLLKVKRLSAPGTKTQAVVAEPAPLSDINSRIACTQQKFLFRAPFLLPDSEAESMPFTNFPFGVYTHDMDSQVIAGKMRLLFSEFPPEHVSLLATRLFRAVIIQVVVSNGGAKPPPMNEWLTNWPSISTTDTATDVWPPYIQEGWKLLVAYIRTGTCLGQVELHVQTRVLAMVALRLGANGTATDVSSLKSQAGPRVNRPPTTLLDRWHKTIPRRLLLIAIPTIRSSLMRMATGQSPTLFFDVEAHVWGWLPNMSVQQMAANTMLGLLVCGELTICQPVAAECHQFANKGTLPDPFGVWEPVQSTQTQIGMFGVMDRLSEIYMSVLVQSREALPLPLPLSLPLSPPAPVPVQVSGKNDGVSSQATRARNILAGLRPPKEDDDYYLAKVLQLEANGNSHGAASGGCIVPTDSCTWTHCRCFVLAEMIGSLVVSGMNPSVHSGPQFTTLVIVDQYKFNAVWSSPLLKLVQQNPGFSFCVCTAHVDRKGDIQWETRSCPVTTAGPKRYPSLYLMELPTVTKTIVRKLNSSFQLGDIYPMPMKVDRLVWDTVCAHHKSPEVSKGSDCIDVFESWQTPIGSKIQWLILPHKSVAYCMTRGRESKLRLLSSIGLDADNRRVFNSPSHIVFNLTDTFIQAPLKSGGRTNLNVKSAPTNSRTMTEFTDGVKLARHLEANLLDPLDDTQQDLVANIRERLTVNFGRFRLSSRFQFIQTANATLQRLKCKQSLFSYEMSDVQMFDAAVLLLTDPSHRQMLYTQTGKIGGALHARHILELATGVDIMRIKGARSILSDLYKVGIAILTIPLVSVQRVQVR
jgi:hypothetical protein